MNLDNDFELVRKFNAGDESAFNEIVKKYQKKYTGMQDKCLVTI
ncbi:hypothetical protein VJY32_10735 [Ignavibacteria bacterium 4148-Me]